MVVAASFPLVLLIFCSVPLKFGEGACVFPQVNNKWKARVAFEAAWAGHPNIDLPKIGSGFNRTLNIDGACNAVLWNSENFKCDASLDFASLANPPTRTEWHADVQHSTGVALHFDNANCPLRGVTVAHSAPGSHFYPGLEMRLQFEYCKAAAGFPPPPVASAAIVVGLKEETGGIKTGGVGPNLLNWMKEVCHYPASGTPAPKTIVQSVGSANKEFPTPGKCDGDVLEQRIAGLKEACSIACTGEQAGLEKCTGFAFNEKATANTTDCILYKSKITKILQARRLNGTASTAPTTMAPTQELWRCVAQEVAAQSTLTSTLPPSQQVLHKKLFQQLQINQVMGGGNPLMKEARLLQIDPPPLPGGAPGNCFASAWWFLLQDEQGHPASIVVSGVEWAEIMKMVPPLKEITQSVPSKITVDRILVKTCQEIDGWHRPCIMPPKHDRCSPKQLINAIVAGLVTPIVAWALAYAVYKAFRPNNGFAQDDTSPTCTVKTVIPASIMGLIASLGAAAAATFATSAALSSSACKHGIREELVVVFSAGFSSAIAIIISLMYLFKSTKVSAERKDDSQPKLESKLMLVEVPDASGHAIIRNADLMESGGLHQRQTGAMGGTIRVTT